MIVSLISWLPITRFQWSFLDFVDTKRCFVSTKSKKWSLKARVSFVYFLYSNIKDKEGNTPLHTAAHNGFLDVLQVLVEGVEGANPLKINERNATGFTALCSAVAEDRLECAKLLIRAVRQESNVLILLGSCSERSFGKWNDASSLCDSE